MGPGSNYHFFRIWVAPLDCCTSSGRQFPLQNDDDAEEEEEEEDEEEDKMRWEEQKGRTTEALFRLSC